MSTTFNVSITETAFAGDTGLKRYFTGKPCRSRGHVCERVTQDCKRVECQCINRRNWDVANPRTRAENRIYAHNCRNKHREAYREYQRIYQRKWHARKLEEQGLKPRF